MSETADLEGGLAALEELGVLRGGAGESGNGRARALELDGQSLGACPVLHPRDSEALGQSLSILSGHRMTALVRGGGSQLGIGNSPKPIDVVLDTRSLSGVGEFEQDDGVVQVRGGTALSLLRPQVEAEGWVLPLDPPGGAATVGGTLAAGAFGPRVLRYGRPRDCVLGLDVVLASGEHTSCGGRVVKNVTGYDMAKLYTGSFGTLGVIESAWLRLAPTPELERTLAVASVDFEAMFALALEASRRSTARAAALLSPKAARRARAGADEADDRWLLAQEFAGDEVATRSDAEWLRDRAKTRGLAVVEFGSGGFDRVRAMQQSTFEVEGVRVRVAVPPTALPTVVGAIADACEGLALYPGVGLLYAFSAGGIGAGTSALDACTRAAVQAGGSVVFEALPPAAKADRDVFGEFGPELALMRKLKQRFDPAAVLNPGRFAGRI